MKTEDQIKAKIDWYERFTVNSKELDREFVAGLRYVLDDEYDVVKSVVEQRVSDLYDNFVNLNEMGFRGLENELDLLAFLLGKKCSYELPARPEVC